MTTEEYNKKLRELREQRDFHRRESERYAYEMDVLTTDVSLAELHIGKYVKYKWLGGDISHHNSYTYYLNVESVEVIRRGFYLHGHGFSKTAENISHIKVIRCYWEDASNGNITDITEEEYFAALKSSIKAIEKEIIEKTPFLKCQI